MMILKVKKLFHISWNKKCNMALWSQIWKQDKKIKQRLEFLQDRFTCISRFVTIKLNTVVYPRFYKIKKVNNEIQRKPRAAVKVLKWLRPSPITPQDCTWVYKMRFQPSNGSRAFFYEQLRLLKYNCKQSQRPRWVKRNAAPCRMASYRNLFNKFFYFCLNNVLKWNYMHFCT